MNVVSGLLVLPDEHLLLAASKDTLLAFRYAGGGDVRGELENMRAYWRGDLDTMKRLLK